MREFAGPPGRVPEARKKQKKSRAAPILLFMLAGIAVAGIVAYLWFYISGTMDEVQEADAFRDSMEKLQEEVVTDVDMDPVSDPHVCVMEEHVPTDPAYDLDIRVDFEALSNINPDIIAWLYLPDTYISFPVLQERVLMEYYYLNHDYKGERSAAGAVFTPAEPLGIEDAHMLLFGHHSRHEGVAFSGLHDLYGEQEEGIRNRYIYLLYPDRTEQYELWTAVESDSEDAVYEIPYQLETDGYKELLSGMGRKGLYVSGEAPGEADRTLVLSTCNGRAGGRERFYVVFRHAGTEIREGGGDG